MRTLKNALKIAAVFVIAICFTASAQKKPAAPVAKTQKKGNIFVSVEKQPGFPGGRGGLGKYLSKNVKYPAIDRENNVQGKVFVSLVVEPDGRVTGVDAVRGPSATLKAEAVRVMKLSPKWTPGMQGGKKVRTQYTVPINFTLGGEEVSSSAGAPPKPTRPVAKNQNGDKVYVSVEEAPQFPGGLKEMGKYLETNIKYPAIDRENNLQGKVYVSFIVEPDGSVSEVSAERGPSETLKAEAVRVMKNSPKWIPGMQAGKKVRTQYTVPINFTLGA